MDGPAGVALVIGGGAAGVAAFCYLVMPLMVPFSNHIAAEPVLNDTRFDELELFAALSIRRVVEGLGKCGFEVIANVSNAGVMYGSNSVQLLLLDEAAGCWAEAFYVAVNRPPAPKVELWTLVFRTRFADGSEIATGCSQSATAYPRNAQVDGINASWVSDPAKLFDIHAARVARSPRPAAERILPPRGQDAVDFLVREHRREMQRVAAHGYYRLEPQRKQYKMTFKGAYLMTWRLLWPVKQWRRRTAERHARRVVEQLDLRAA